MNDFTPSGYPNTSGVAPPSSPSSAGWREIKSPAMTHLLRAELTSHGNPFQLPEDVLAVIKSAAQDDGTLRVADHISVWVNIKPLFVYANHREDKAWFDTALQYCIVRQAHYPLIRQLFDISKPEYTALRKAQGVTANVVRNKTLPDCETLNLWRAWTRIQATYDRAIDQWVTLAEEYPQYPLSIMHQALVTDAHTATDAPVPTAVAS
jgi:Protein of unknown function (DUF2857)